MKAANAKVVGRSGAAPAINEGGLVPQVGTRVDMELGEEISQREKIYDELYEEYLAKRLEEIDREDEAREEEWRQRLVAGSWYERELRRGLEEV
jgi:hypothetical protein